MAWHYHIPKTTETTELASSISPSACCQVALGLDDCPLTVALPAALGAVAPIRPRAPNAVLVVPRKPGGLGVLVPWGETFDPLDVVFASANDCINLYYIVKSYHQSAIIHYD